MTAGASGRLRDSNDLGMTRQIAIAYHAICRLPEYFAGSGDHAILANGSSPIATPF